MKADRLASSLLLRSGSLDRDSAFCFYKLMYCKKKGLIGRFDGKRISREYEGRINTFRETLKRKETAAEVHFRAHIAKVIRDDARCPFREQKAFYITDEVAFITDFYFPKFRVVIEVDGSSHYGWKSRERDKWRDGLLLVYAGVSTLRVSNSAVTKKTIDVFNQVVRFLAVAPQATPYHQSHLREVYSHLLPYA